MGILSLKPSSFIINLGITLVLSGLIMVYVKQKFASYDRQFNTIDNHLKTLVSMVQKQSASFASSSGVNWHGQSDSKTGLNSDSSLAAEGAVEAAKETHEKFGGGMNYEAQKNNIKSLNRIIVSDNETDSDNTDESGSESESESESEDVEEIGIDNLKFNGEIKQIFITSEEPMHFLNNLMVLGNQKTVGGTFDLDNLQVDELENESDSSDIDSSDDSDYSGDEVDDMSTLDLVNLENLETSETKLVSFIRENKVDIIEQNGNLYTNISEVDETLTQPQDQPQDQSPFQCEFNEVNDKLITDDELEPLNMNLGQLVEMSKNHLQDLCKSRNMSVKGSKKELIDRLLNK